MHNQMTATQEMVPVKQMTSFDVQELYRFVSTQNDEQNESKRIQVMIIIEIFLLDCLLNQKTSKCPRL